LFIEDIFTVVILTTPVDFHLNYISSYNIIQALINCKELEGT
jgi:hypothetical protein